MFIPYIKNHLEMISAFEWDQVRMNKYAFVLPVLQADVGLNQNDRLIGVTAGVAK